MGEWGVRRFPKAIGNVRWGVPLALVVFCLVLTASTLRGQILKSLFHKDKPVTTEAPPGVTVTELPYSDSRTDDGGYLAKQRYDALTGTTTHDQARLLASVKPFFEKQFPPTGGSEPKVAGATMLNDDSLCETCHLNVVKYHRTDIHRNQACESCHGPASEHVKSRGKDPGTIISFKTVKPADGNEVCLKCHDQTVKDHFATAKWRVSTHAHADTACTACHTSHYNIPAGTPATKVGDTDSLPPRAKETEAVAKSIRETFEAMGRPGAANCYKCHGTTPGAPPTAVKINDMRMPGTPHQVDGPNQFKCTTCHDPHGVLRKEVRTDLCIQCHQMNPHVATWARSSHAKSGMACVDCHNPHASTPKLGASETSTCYKCHNEKADLEKVAHPHQVNGVNGFKCATCHNPHDNIRRENRVDQCLACHKGHPTMAWKSSTHSLQQVTCTDCHNPHPSSNVPVIVDIDHNHVDRPKRMPMSVEEPRVCYRCHTRIAGLFNMPFHHPVPEGKMLCSACHDVHGSESDKLLKQPTVNLTCYKCHSSKQGPFVYEHPPVTENCMICHNPHGTVVKELLKQPPTFLCLRCHSGHNGSHHVKLVQIPSHQAAFYTDCTQCHHQIHGSDLPAIGRNGTFFHR